MKNDKFLHIFLKNPNVKVYKNGTILIKKYNKWVKVGCPNRSGYLSFGYLNHKFFCHRLVYFFFNKNIDSKKVINHKNGNKKDNRLSNLENISYSQNSLHKFKHKNYKKQLKKRKFKNKKPSITLLKKLVNDKNYKIYKNGKITTNIPEKGSHFLKRKRTIKYSVQMGYFIMRYKMATFLVHRVIFYKFNNFLTKGKVINHKDNNPKNNHILNLEEITYSKNRTHYLTNHYKYKITQNQINKIRTKYLLSKNFSIKKEAFKLKISKSYLSSIITNKKRKNKKYQYIKKKNITSKVKVLEMRRLFLTKELSQIKICKKYKVNYSTGKDILNNRSHFSKRYEKSLNSLKNKKS